MRIGFQIFEVIFTTIWLAFLTISIAQFYTRRGILYRTILEIAKKNKPDLNEPRFRIGQITVGCLLLIGYIVSKAYEVSNH